MGDTTGRQRPMGIQAVLNGVLAVLWIMQWLAKPDVFRGCGAVFFTVVGTGYVIAWIRAKRRATRPVPSEVPDPQPWRDREEARDL